VLADDSADARSVAADLLAQAEHGSGHERTWLITPSASLLRQVKKELERQLKILERRNLIQRALDHHGWLVHVADLDQGIACVNQLAPEHCEVMTRDAARVAERITTAGAIFLGPHSPTVLGDYLAGPSHTLPTGGAGASFSGLTVDQFQRRTSVIQYDLPALKRSLEAVRQFATIEGLDAHQRSLEVRIKKAAPRRRTARSGQRALPMLEARSKKTSQRRSPKRRRH